MLETISKRPLIKHLPKAIVLLFIALLFACGSSATATPVSPSSAKPTATTSGAPTAMPEATKEAPAAVKRGGIINMGQKETGIFEAHPSMSSSPRIQFTSSTVGEGLITTATDFSAAPMLAKSWSVSDDFLTWTWKFQEGVQFHKGYGEMHASDVLYSYMQWHEGAKHARAGIIGSYFNHPDGGSTIIDDYTLEVNTGVPWVPAQVFEFMRNAGGSSSWTVSEKQSEEIGIEAASKDIAATGPWQIEDSESGVSWTLSAVQDHWRQTPYFDELVYWTIPEESARVAGFQTGTLDSFDMAFDSLTTVEAVAGAQVKGFANAGQAGLNFYGQLYGVDKDGNAYEHYDCTNAWVSCDMDTESEEWAKAVNVRKAMNIAIDRQTIVDTLLSGFGRSLAVRDWMGHDARANPDWVYDYDPDLAKQMIADAGFPDGFSITLTPAIRGAVAETEACEAVAQYWEAIGLDVQFKNTPYATLRPEIIARNYIGATCHTVGVRLSPIVGASNYETRSTFSYGTHHPWLDENVRDAAEEVDPVKAWEKNLKVYNWIFDNSMASAIYVHDAIWPIGKRISIEGWEPTDWSEVRTAVAFEYARPN
ncbi:MAG: ABC transporter substrate-binding protein [SAR202 cluster bacterium]|nr:ABC transporter substrate-binding protein [SAR202 cluster bacterium]